MQTPDLVVLCYLWNNGWRKGTYGPQHVERLRDVLKATLSLEHRFVCVTDEKIKGVETVPLPSIPWQVHHVGLPCGYFKLWSFSREAAKLGKRLLVIDLDTIVLQDLAPLLAAGDGFTCLRGFSCPYGSAIYQLQAGLFPDVWECLTPELARQANKTPFPDGRRYYGSDQAVMAMMLPGHPTWTDADGIYHENRLVSKVIPKDCRALVFGNHVKPWQGPFAAKYWGSA